MKAAKNVIFKCSRDSEEWPWNKAFENNGLSGPKSEKALQL